MGIWIKQIGLLSIIVASGCSPGSPDQPVQELNDQSKVWTADAIRIEQTACEQSFKQTNPAYMGEAARPYCECVFEEITSRWSHKELQQAAPSIIDTLTKEGVISRCQIAAASQAGRNAAKASVSQEAAAGGMPDGFLGVKLLTSPTDLQTIRPNVQRTPNGWYEVAEWNGAPFRAFYKFDESENGIIIILLQRPSNQASYMTIQSRLDKDFGPLTKPSAAQGMLLQSERSSGGVALVHNLIEGPDGTLAEQVMLYKMR